MIGKMSDSESEYFRQAPITMNRKLNPAGNNGKRKSRTTSTTLTRPSEKNNAGNDIFGISNNHETCQFKDDSSNITSLTSFFANRVANGCELRAASSNGEYYIDCKVYKADDARHMDSMELWKRAFIRLKIQTDTDYPQWRKLQEFVRSADMLFVEKPMF